MSNGLETELKKTPLYSLHVEAGAKMGEFAGYSMPLFYPLGLMKEHLHTRQQAGLFDISHMLHMDITGPGAADAIARACPYEPSSQAIGSGKYTFFLNDNAGILDDLIVTRLGEQRYRIVANAGCAEKDHRHIVDVASGFDAEVTQVPCGFLALQGPASVNVLEAAGYSLSDMDFMTATEPDSDWFVSRSGYTGEDGFEIAMPIGETESFARKLLSDERVEPIGLGARDSLRLEAGLSLYGQDLSEEITPHEAGLIWAIPKPLREGGNFIGAQALAEKIAAGRNRMRIGLTSLQKVPVRAGAMLNDGNGREIGLVTSGGFGPSAGKPVALGLIDTDAKDGEFFADVRGKQIEMQRADLPFIAHNYKR